MSTENTIQPATPDSRTDKGVGCGDLVRLSGSEIIALERSRQIATVDQRHSRSNTDRGGWRFHLLALAEGSL